MPASLSQLVRNHARLVLDFGAGASLTIDYRPVRVTPRQLHRLGALQDKPYQQMTEAEKAAQLELLDEQTHLLADCLIAWDLLNDAGGPIPPTYEGLQDVDTDAQGLILQAIIEDQRMGKSTAPNAPANGAASMPANRALSVGSSTDSPWEPPPAPPSPPSPTGTGI